MGVEMSTTERYIVTARKLPRERRDAFRALAHRDTYEDVHPGEVGEQVSYSMDLSPDDIERVERASNLVDLVRLPDLGLGYVPRDDPRDKDYPASGALKEMGVPGEARDSWSWRRGPILNQGKEGSCTGHGARAFLDAEPTMTPPDSGPSAVWIYEQAKKVDEMSGEDYDGSTVNAACKVLRSQGYIAQWTWASSFEEVRDWLLYKGCVMFGLDWYEGCCRADAKGFVRPTGRCVGGHALLGHGISVHGSVRLQNSWGESFGEGGEAWLSKDDLTNTFMRSNNFKAACAVQTRR